MLHNAAHRRDANAANLQGLPGGRLARLLGELSSNDDLRPTLDTDAYSCELNRLQGRLVRLQEWVHHKKLKLLILFEGRDAAGKGGTIKRITQRLNPRTCRVVALPAPTEIERTQWYFQRYAAHLPAGGDIVLFDRSWYNRAGVERVMGFCNDEEYEEFLCSVPEFERMLTRSGITLVKYWLSITYEVQHHRLLQRIQDPLKRWKLSAMDIEARRRWEQYTEAKQIMMRRTHTVEAPWWIIDAVDKRRARLNCIRHFLEQVPHEEVPQEPVALPELTGRTYTARNDMLLRDMQIPSYY
jgi:polyphosphate kinase 2